jgi:hypothetical protein
MQQMPRTSKTTNKYMMELKDKLLVLETNADTAQILCSHALAWLNNCEYPVAQEMVPDASRYLIKAVKEQHLTRWQHWFKGRISNTWGDIYHHDIQNPHLLVNFPSVQQWGKEINKTYFNLCA